MLPKEIVSSFYLSNALLDNELIKKYIHQNIQLDWNSSKGFLQMNYSDLVDLATEMKKSYHESRINITHLLQEENTVTIRYVHHVKTIENKYEEMVLAHFMVIWEIKDNLLYKGYQMSQLG